MGRLDLLGIDELGKLVIVELKRDRTPREAVAQALDYASWLDSVDVEEIEAHAEQHLQKPLSEAFIEFFQTELPEYTCQNHRIVLAATRLDESAERIINYLVERHKVEINASSPQPRGQQVCVGGSHRPSLADWAQYGRFGSSGAELVNRSRRPSMTASGQRPPSLASRRRGAN